MRLPLLTRTNLSDEYETHPSRLSLLTRIFPKNRRPGSWENGAAIDYNGPWV